MHTTYVFLVVDMLADFFERQPALAAQRSRLVDAINQLAARMRDVGQPVIWVRQEFKPDLSDAFLDMRREGIELTIAGTPGSRLLPELHQATADHVIVKKRYSAFFGTTLDELLATFVPATLVVAGVNTHACIRTTVIDAYQRDFDVIVASDCIASYDAEHHDVTARYLEGHIARFMSNVDIGQRLAASRAGDKRDTD